MTSYPGHHNPDFWPQLLARFREAGITYVVVSRTLKCHPSTVTRWAQGINRPKFDESIALLKLAEKHEIAFKQLDTV